MNFIKVRTVSSNGDQITGTELINVDMIGRIHKTAYKTPEGKAVFDCSIPHSFIRIDETDAHRIFLMIGVSL